MSITCSDCGKEKPEGEFGSIRRNNKEVERTPIEVDGKITLKEVHVTKIVEAHCKECLKND